MDNKTNQSSRPEIASTSSNTSPPYNQDPNISNEQKKTINNFIKEVDKWEDKMNTNNKNAYRVLKNEGIDKAVQFMFKHPETGQPMDYGTMRYYYG